MRHPNVDWIDVCIQEQLDVGEFLSRLDDTTVQGAWEEERMVHLYWAEDQWSEERLAAVRSVLVGLVPVNREIQLSVTRVPVQDWNETWVRSVKPLRIGRLVIRPSWESAPLDLKDIEIVLDPKQAFGTGHHATTRMLLEWLQADIHGGERIVDVGAGSAILAMAAVKLGAESALGLEIDAVAAECAREYVVHNGLHDRIDIIVGTLADISEEKRKTEDLVLANLDRQTILSLAEELATCAYSGARLLLSGILVEQEPEIAERFSNLGLVGVARREEDGWVAMHYLKPECCDGEE